MFSIKRSIAATGSRVYGAATKRRKISLSCSSSVQEAHVEDTEVFASSPFTAKIPDP